MKIKNKKRWVSVGVTVVLAVAGVTLPPEQMLLLSEIVGAVVGG